MSEKNWLIRTRQKQVLGPVSKEKIIEFIENGSLVDDDEITSGNGYWIWVREKEFVEKYLYGDFPQTFNPISEATDVLTANNSQPDLTTSFNRAPTDPVKKEVVNEDAASLPEDGDLEYPDMDDLEYPDMSASENVEDDVPSLSLSESSSSSVSSSHSSTPKIEEPSIDGDDENWEGKLPDGDDLDYPDMGLEDDDVTDPNVSIPVQEVEEVEEEPEFKELPKPTGKAKKSKKVKNKRTRKRAMPTPVRNDRYLVYIALVIVIIIASLFYYYRKVLNKPLPLLGINTVHAQTIDSLSKKKV